jgi:anaerobic ribonucleoside-triphosphate reductase activating protein
VKITGNSFINAAELCSATFALGPGLRSALFVMGCPLNCVGCIAPDWQPFEKKYLISPEEAAGRLLVNPQVTGVTLSGGEPTLQAPALVELIRLLRKQRELHIICFSGYRYEVLQNRHPDSKVRELLDAIDILIDGPFIQSQNTGESFAGSLNQRIIQLSDRPLPKNSKWENRRIELRLREGSILTLGVPPFNWNLDAVIDGLRINPKIQEKLV